MGYQLNLRRRQGLPLHRGGLKGLVGRNEDEGHMGLAVVTGMSKDKSTCIKDQSKGWTKIKGKGERTVPVKQLALLLTSQPQKKGSAKDNFLKKF